ncbi:MAG: hypothetical protein OEY43_03235 [Gammaproteobacteria bacterium]|nr:hypothetical protein [Gammaproteobacteria bacterium]
MQDQQHYGLSHNRERALERQQLQLGFKWMFSFFIFLVCCAFLNQLLFA